MISFRQFVPSKVCFHCDVCCRFTEPDTAWLPFVTEEEAARWVESGYPPAILNDDKHINPIPEGDLYVCPFFDVPQKMCTIYTQRPLDCALYPFVLKREGDAAFLCVDTQCPFVLKTIETEDFKEYSEYLSEILSLDTARALLKHNPQLFGDYKDTVVVLQKLADV
ncbi:YkgJ family cysteine cluster protein [Candidatus Omnitrophota bacterium]